MQNPEKCLKSPFIGFAACFPMASDKFTHQTPTEKQTQQARQSTQQTTGKANPAPSKAKQKTTGKASPLGVRHPKANPAKQKGPMRAD